MARTRVRYSPRVVVEMCHAIADGQSLRSICAQTGMPTKTGFLRWVAQRPNVQRRYEKALELRGEHYAEQIIEIADELPAPVTVNGKQVIEITKGFIARQRIRLDARKWTAARLLPKKYGDKLMLADPNGNPLPAPQLIATVDPAEAARIYQKLMTGPGA